MRKRKYFLKELGSTFTRTTSPGTLGEEKQMAAQKKKTDETKQCNTKNQPQPSKSREQLNTLPENKRPIRRTPKTPFQKK